jgi:hypothetical protein
MYELAHSCSPICKLVCWFEKRGRSKAILGGVDVKRGFCRALSWLASHEFYQISCSWKSEWFVSDDLIPSLGDTASQILRMLPKIKVLCRDVSPMSYDEISAVSKSIVSLTCMKGFDFGPAHVDISSLIFTRLKKVDFKSEKDSDFQFIATVLKNSIPQGRGFLKSLFLMNSRSAYPTTNSSVGYAQFIPSLIKVIEVWFHSLMQKASYGLNVLQLNFNNMPETVNFDSSLDSIFRLDQITTLYGLYLVWEGMSVDKIKSSLRKQGGKKRWELLVLGEFDQDTNDAVTFPLRIDCR